MNLNSNNVEKLLSLMGAVTVSDLKDFIEAKELNLDEYDMYELITYLYSILENC